MTFRASASIAGALGLVLSPVASADLVGLTFEVDSYGVDGVTPLVEVPGYEGQVVYNIYAVFDEEQDQCLGVVGSPQHPFQVHTCHGTGFVNPTPGHDTPPTPAQLAQDPTLHFDSFMTIGLTLGGPGNQLIVSAGTPGPNTDPWPLNSITGMNMAWIVPPTIDGKPTPQSVPDAQGRVLIMRLSAVPGEGMILSMGLLVFNNGEGDELPAFLAMPLECPCPGDATLDGTVDVLDLVGVILEWGAAGGSPDLNLDGTVDVQDLTLVIVNWGPC